MNITKEKEFNAHYDDNTQQYQSVYAHLTETADYAVKKNPIPFLENTIWLICIFHDAGKYTKQWQEYFENKIKDTKNYSGPREDHTTAGGQLIEELFPKQFVSVIIQTAIYSHHGLQNCISPVDSSSLYIKRMNKAKQLPMEECRQQFYKEIGQREIQHRCLSAKEEGKQLRNHLLSTLKSWEQTCYGKLDFYMGMYQRLLCSLLIDADRRNTEDFASSKITEPPLSDNEIQDIWKICQENVERKISEFKDYTGINEYRMEISNTCRSMAERTYSRYRLSVPTGAGKTLSSLRFAVAHGKKFHKKRIIYAAPYQSIIEQNSKHIKEALGMADIVLEHHCNIIMESEELQNRYDRLTEDWSSPVIVTTAVQFFNSLFAGKSGNIRRMHSLCDSVILVDEGQALPVKVLELFNLAVNFLTEFANSTVVLCTATQPLLEKTADNRMRPAVDMVTGTGKYKELLRRTQIIDCTWKNQNGMDIDEIAGFILEKANKHKKVLFIANTKESAKNIFLRLNQLCGESPALSHLSTNMYPSHRSCVLEAVKNKLGKKEEMQICISTQLIEAGVDISFCCVIRSLAGLDSIIQAAGRCNRNKEEEMGYVYLVKLGKEAEDVSRLRYIRIGQGAMKTVLDQFHRKPESLDNRLDSEKAIKKYFKEFLNKQITEYGNPLSFPVNVEGVGTNMVELLSDNPEFSKIQEFPNRFKGQPLKQAFKTAGEKFEVIAEDGKVAVVVCCEKPVEKKLSDLDNPYASLKDKKQILRELQSYTVSISQTMRNKMGKAIYPVWGGRVLALEGRYYDNRIGVTTEPKPMEQLIC